MKPPPTITDPVYFFTNLQKVDKFIAHRKQAAPNVTDFYFDDQALQNASLFIEQCFKPDLCEIPYWDDQPLMNCVKHMILLYIPFFPVVPDVSAIGRTEFTKQLLFSQEADWAKVNIFQVLFDIARGALWAITNSLETNYFLPGYFATVEKTVPAQIMQPMYKAYRQSLKDDYKRLQAAFDAQGNASFRASKHVFKKGGLSQKQFSTRLNRKIPFVDYAQAPTAQYQLSSPPTLTEQLTQLDAKFESASSVDALSDFFVDGTNALFAFYSALLQQLQKDFLTIDYTKAQPNSYEDPEVVYPPLPSNSDDGSSGEDMTGILNPDYDPAVEDLIAGIAASDITDKRLEGVGETLTYILGSVNNPAQLKALVTKAYKQVEKIIGESAGDGAAPEKVAQQMQAMKSVYEAQLFNLKGVLNKLRLNLNREMAEKNALLADKSNLKSLGANLAKERADLTKKLQSLTTNLEKEREGLKNTLKTLAKSVKTTSGQTGKLLAAHDRLFRYANATYQKTGAEVKNALIKLLQTTEKNTKKIDETYRENAAEVIEKRIISKIDRLESKIKAGVGYSNGDKGQFNNAVSGATRFIEMAHKANANDKSITSAIETYTKLLNSVSAPKRVEVTGKLGEVIKLSRELKEVVLDNDKAPLFFLILACRTLEKKLGNIRSSMSESTDKSPLQNKLFLRYYLSEVIRKSEYLTNSDNKKLGLLLKNELQKTLNDDVLWESRLLQAIEGLPDETVVFQSVCDIDNFKTLFETEFLKVTLPTMTMVITFPGLSPF